MAKVAPIPRSRGSVCGLGLLVLGAWGGIAPYAGPSFGYGFNPGAWTYTQGRLYLSALPGGVVLICGLAIMLTRSRGFGGFMSIVAALGGAWFIVGASVVQLLPASLGGSSITVGSPIKATVRQVNLSDIGIFWGVGALIVFFAAVALGRFSIAAQKDAEMLGAWLTATPGGAGAGGPAAVGAGAMASPGYVPVQGPQAFAPTQPQYAADPFTSYEPAQYPPQYPPEQQFEAEQYPAQYHPEPYQPDQYQPEPYASQYPPPKAPDAGETTAGQAGQGSASGAASQETAPGPATQTQIQYPSSG